jgi:hypothetical protein
MYLISFPQISNRASWAFVGQLLDLSNTPIDLTGFSMVFAICRPGSRSCPILIASTDNGKLTILTPDNPGMFRWSFSVDEMKGLCRETYDTGLTLTTPDGSQTVQLSVGPLPVIDGNVP